AHVAALELDPPTDDLPDSGEVAHDAEGHCRLAATGLPDDAHRLARHDAAGEIHDRRDLARPGEERNGEVFDLQDGGGGLGGGVVHGCLRSQSFSDCSRSVSASRFRPSTSDMSENAGVRPCQINSRSCATWLPSLIAVPQSGLSGPMPSPKKPRVPKRIVV